MQERPSVTLPLETLFDRLELAGFDCSPAQRMRAVRLLAALGTDIPGKERLRGLLAPVVVHSAEEQKRFYEIFDRYWAEMQVEEEEAEAPLQKSPGRRWVWKKLVLWAAIILLAGVILEYSGWRPKEATVPVPTFEFKFPDRGYYEVGDTIRCVNTTKIDSTASREIRYSWRIEDVQGSLIQQGPRDTPVWNIVDTPPANGPIWVVTLAYADSLQSAPARKNLTVYCKNRPTFPRLNIPANIQPGQTFHISLAEKPRPHHVYSWNCFDTVFYTPKFSYAFQSNGINNVVFSVQDTSQAGDCSIDTVISFQVGETRVSLPLKKLEYDSVTPVARFRWPFWVLMGIFALAAFFFWGDWLRRTTPPLPEKPPVSGASLPPGWAQATDRPPYYIPFREQKGILKTAREQLRLGDALRLRQEGEDVLLDVPATLRDTVDGGGYPRLRFRFRTRPSEYLFLIDEQMPGKHLARLFRHIAENLRGQDVLLDILWYDRDFHRFWGPALPKGVSVDQLHRLFPHHRLVLLGDGHHLLDAYSDSTPRLRPGLESELAGWKERLLLSPQAPAAWNWRERSLYRHFGLFPADLRGLLDAAAFVENGLDTEDLPVLFEDWQRQQSELREAPADTSYRRWRTLRDHEDYLNSAAAPAAARELLRWLCALAVLPAPTWEITLAVAHALGIDAHHDRLLILSRIPWLQDGALHPRLRRELLAALSDDDERRARMALRDELAAVRPLTADSHAAHELESALAIQEFLLQPEGSEQRTLIGLLLDAGALTRVQEDELDLAVERWDARAAAPMQAVTQGDAPAKRGIRDWLAAQAPEEKVETPPERRVFTADFWKAVACTLVVLLMALVGLFWHNTTALQRFSFSKRSYYPESKMVPGATNGTLNSAFFVEEHWQTDSAVVYNNRGVVAGTYFNRTSQVAGLPISSSDTVGWQDAIPRSIALFEQALTARKNYPLAFQNAANAWYNRAALLLDDEQAPRDSFLQAALDFQRVVMLSETGYPSIRLDAIHGHGVALYYAGLRDSAQAVYRQLQALQYFDTLQVQPNLSTLFAGSLQQVQRNPLAQPTLAITLYDTIPVVSNGKDININAEITRIRGNKPLRNLQFKLYLYLNGRQTPLTNFNGRYSVARNSYILLLRLPMPKPNDVLRVVLESEGEQVFSNRLSIGGPPQLISIPDMLFVRGGTFRMGSPEDDKDAVYDEKPAHNVRLSDFYIGKTEVTNAQYAAFLNDYGSIMVKSGRYAGQVMVEDLVWGIRFPDEKGVRRFSPYPGYENHPVIMVSWCGAVEYCNWLSQKTGRNFRLPTEAEWEYAARGGPQWRDSLKYAGSNNLDEVAWYGNNSNETTHAVGGKKANQLGAYDMSGNVFEWCSDWYSENYYQQFRNKTAVAPKGPGSGSFRVLRGGSWSFVVNHRSAERYYGDEPTDRDINYGFRLAQD